MWKIVLALLIAAPAAAPALAEPVGLPQLETGWANANYGKAADAARLSQIDSLIAEAQRQQAQPTLRAEALAWQGMLLMTKAGIVRGLAAFRMVQDARRLFEASIAIDPRAAGGLAPRQLGTLYWQVPGFPIAFGSDKKAEQYLKQALAIDRTSLANNLAMGDFLVEKKRLAEAEAYLVTALRDRPHGAAGAGLRGEAVAQLGHVRTQLGKPWNGAELAAGK